MLDRHTDIYRQIHRHRQTDTDTLPDCIPCTPCCIDTQTDREIHRQTDRHRHTTGLHFVYTMLYRHTDIYRQIHRQTDRHTTGQHFVYTMLHTNTTHSK